MTVIFCHPGPANPFRRLETVTMFGRGSALVMMQLIACCEVRVS